MHLALTYTRLRTEERLLLDSFAELGVSIEPVDLRTVVFDPANLGDWARFDAVVDRSVSLTASITATHILEGLGVRCVNPGRTVELCSDKLRTTIELERAGVPTPGVRVGLEAESALAAIEEIGYPAVIKPAVGSWGRLVSRVNDRDAAEAIIEHREVLGGVSHGVHYIQEHINKPGRDLRVFVVGGEPVAAIARSSGHWVTNTARGAQASGLTITPEIATLCRRAAACVGADVVAIDLLECPDRGLLVNELNHSMEFRNSIATSGIDIPKLVAQRVVAIVNDRATLAQPAGASA